MSKVQPNASPSKLRSDLRNNTALLAKMLVLVGITGMIYGTDLSVVFMKALTFSAGNITNYVLVIPLLILFVLLRKRKVLIATATWRTANKDSLRLDDVIGATLCAIAVTLYVIGSTTLYSLEYHLLSLPVFVAGGVLLLFNLATLRHSFIAIIFLAYLQPPPADLLAELAADMSWSSAILVQSMLEAIGLPISIDASFGAPALVMQDANGAKVPFYVGEPSSGTYSIVGLSVFSIFVAYILRGKLWKRALVLAVGFPVFYLLNAVRIATIISIWYTSGEAAAESFHVVSGSVMSAVGTLVLLFFADLVLRLGIRGRPRKKEKCPACEKSLDAGESLCLLCGRVLRRATTRINSQLVSRMFLFVLISGLVIAAQIAAVQGVTRIEASQLPLYNLNIATIKGPETASYFFPAIEGWDLKYAYRDDKIEKILNQDASLAYRYTSNANASTTTGGKPTILAGLQISRTLHTWEGSLLVYPSKFGRPQATVLDIGWIDLTDDKKARFFAYKKPGLDTTEAVLYWTDKRELRFNSGLEARNVQIILWANLDSLARMGVIENSSDTEKTKEILLSLARPINAYWEEISISSINLRTVDAIITKRPYIPFGITFAIAALFSVAILSKQSSIQKSNRKLYDQIKVGEEKLILDALIAPKKGTGYLVTGEAIVESHPDLSTNVNIAPKFTDMLAQIRNLGLIEAKIVSYYDEPTLIWRPNFIAFNDKRALSQRIKLHFR